EIGVDYRSISQKITISGGGSSADLTESLSGAELVLGAGVHILLARTFRLIPKISVGLGAFSHPSCDSSSGNCSIDESRFNTASHAFVFIGLGGYYNIDLH